MRFVWFFVLLLTQFCECLKCYDCNSLQDPLCNGQNEEFLVDCYGFDDFDVICRKTTVFVFNEWEIIRNCAHIDRNSESGSSDLNLLGKCTTRTSSAIYIEWCNCNDGDGCNGSSGLKGFDVIGILGIGVFFSLSFLIVY